MCEGRAIILQFTFLPCTMPRVYIFFFSSRRRHTRLQGDWSSDVCSSDLSRIAELSARRRFEPALVPATPLPTSAPSNVPANGAEIVRVSTAPQAGQQKAVAPEQIVAAHEELTARLNAEIRPERRAQLSRGDLAKLVDAAVHAYFVRNSIEAN